MRTPNPVIASLCPLSQRVFDPLSGGHSDLTSSAVTFVGLVSPTDPLTRALTRAPSAPPSVTPRLLIVRAFSLLGIWFAPPPRRGFCASDSSARWMVITLRRTAPKCSLLQLLSLDFQ